MRFRTYLIIATLIVITSFMFLEYFGHELDFQDDSAVNQSSYAEYKVLKHGGAL